jgi:hypothetical protein
MRHRRLLLAALGSALALCTTSANALVRNDNTNGNPGLVQGSVRITGAVSGTGTVVGDGNWVLTAGHVIQGLGGTGVNCTITLQGGATIQGTTGIFQNAAFTPDWGLIHLSQNAPNLAVPIAANNAALEDTLTMVGWGQSDPVAGSGNNGTPSGTPRQGQNVVNIIDGPGALIGFDFDLAGGNAAGPNFTGATAFPNGDTLVDTDARDGVGNAEATTFAGDSGMGYLDNIGGTLQLVGVHDGIWTPAGAAGLNQDQVESYGTPISSFRAQIASVIPEPSTLALLGLGAFGLLRRRARQ